KCVLERRRVVDLHGHHPIGADCLEEFSYITGVDRIARLRAAVLTGIAEIGNDRSYARRRCVLKGGDEEQQAAELVVGALAPITVEAVNDIDVAIADID